MGAVAMAFKSILANKMRSFLTMLGIIIGVLAIVVLVSIAQGANAVVTSNIEQLGTNLLTVNLRLRGNNPVTLARLQELAQSPDIAFVAPSLSSSGTVKAGTTKYEDGSLLATTPGMAPIRNYTLAQGRFITTPDVDNRSFVAVLGSEAAQELFGSTRVVGESFTYLGYSFTVVGVLAPLGSSFMGSGDNLIILPFSLGERLFSRKGISSFYVSALSGDKVTAAEADVKAFLEGLIKRSSSSSTYSIYNQTSMLETLSSTTATLTLMLGGIAAISLLVGGIGIMNIMLVSVSERTHEIGIRKAIGASRFSILSQFLVEALVVCLLGGLLGILLSVAGTRFLGPLLSMHLSVSPAVAAVAVGFSLLVGVVFGMYPASKASKLRPVDALRHE
ncbi:MAG: ABC transporter permease [Christensenellales bacterium]